MFDARKNATGKAFDPGGEETERLCPVRAPNGFHFHWSQMFHPFQQGNTTNREQQLQENKAEMQETGAHKQMVANKQTNTQKENTITNPRKW